MYTVEDIVQLLLFPGLQASQFTCSKVPTSIHKSVSFINHLEDQKDVVADDMGVWKNNGVDTTRVAVTFSEDHVKEVKRLSSSLSSGGKIYSVKRVYRTHATDGALKKITSYLYGMYEAILHTVIFILRVFQFINVHVTFYCRNIRTADSLCTGRLQI